jgi:predicted XRE-type DNA-binding protein
MIALSKVIKTRRLTRAKAAVLFGVTQPRVSDLIRGKIDRFSVDTLVAMLGRPDVSAAEHTGTSPPHQEVGCSGGSSAPSRKMSVRK